MRAVNAMASKKSNGGSAGNSSQGAPFQIDGGNLDINELNGPNNTAAAPNLSSVGPGDKTPGKRAALMRKKRGNRIAGALNHKRRAKRTY